MSIRLALILLVLLVACSDEPAPLPPEEPPPEPPAKVLQPVRHHRATPLPPAPAEPPAPVPEPPPPPTEAAIGGATVELLSLADRARRDAAGYVLWDKSRPENIATLGELTANLNGAIVRMQRARTEAGAYQPADVEATAAALLKLRTFLSTKGD